MPTESTTTYRPWSSGLQGYFASALPNPYGFCCGPRSRSGSWSSPLGPWCSSCVSLCGPWAWWSRRPMRWRWCRGPVLRPAGPSRHSCGQGCIKFPTTWYSWFSPPKFPSPSSFPLNIFPNSLKIIGKMILLPLSLFFYVIFFPTAIILTSPLHNVIFFPNRLNKVPHTPQGRDRTGQD